MLMRYEHPPDGGWGWMVTFTTCLAYASWGVPRGFSVLFDNFKDNFQSTNSETSWIISLVGGFLLCGTLLGSLINSAFGARVTMMSGGLLSCIGMVIISQANTLNIAYFGSIVAGVGFGFAYCSGSSQIGMYFDKKRSLAFGIAAIGSPASSTFMPLVLVSLTDTYGWRGAVLILGGICLHLAVGGALLRPILFIAGFQPVQSCCKDDVQPKLPLKETGATKFDSAQSLAILELKKNVDQTNSLILEGMQYPKVDTLNVLDALSISTLNVHGCNNEQPANLNLARCKDEHISKSLPHLYPPDHLRQYPKFNASSQTGSKLLLLGKDKDNENHLSLDTTEALPEDDRDNQLTTSIIVTPAISRVSLDNDYSLKSNCNSFRTLLKPYVSLIKQWRFMLFCLVGVLDFAVRLTPASFIVVHARTQGISKDEGALLLVIFAIFDTIIRPISGFLTNKVPQARLRKGVEIFAFGCTQFIFFVLNIAGSLATKFSTFSVYMAVYGLMNGLNSSWCFPILSRLVPVDHLRHAIGIFHFLCGFGFIGGPPLAGFLADYTGHYYAVFYFASVAMFFSCGFAWLLYGLTRKFGLRKLKETVKKEKKSSLIAN